MPIGLVRYQETGHSHFVTFSCFERRPYLAKAGSYELFERALETMRVRYQFLIYGYVVMPEHVHLFLSEPGVGKVSTAIQAIKLSVVVRSGERPFWSHRYYDFNVYSEAKHVEKLRYMHRNPVVRGLAMKPEEWLWSSFKHYATGQSRGVEIESDWTAAKRERLRSLKRDVGEPEG